MRGSLRYRAADIAAEALSSPRGLLAAPRRLVALGAEARRVRAWRRIVLALECGLPDDPLRRLEPPPRAVSKRLAATLGKPAAKAKPRPVHPASERIAELEGLIASDGLVPPTPRTGSVRPPGSVAYMAHAGLPDTVNGYAQRTHALVRAMVAQGADVTVLLRGGTVGERIELDSVRYARIGSLPQHLSYEATTRAYAAAAAVVARDLGASLVHAASNHVTGQAGALAAAALGVPFVYEVRGAWEVTRLVTEPGYEGTVGYRTQRTLEAGTARAASSVLVNGTLLGEALRAAGVPRARIHDVPNGCPAAAALPTAKERAAARRRFGLPEAWDVPVVGFVGSLTVYEGLDRVIRTLADLRDAGLDTALLVVGDGEERSKLEALARSADLRAAVFTGTIAPSDARAALGAIDIAPVVRTPSAVGRLVPPLKPIEAMASGAAVIVSDLPPLAEIGADGRATIVPTGNDPALTEALRSLATDIPRRTAQADRALDWVRRERSWEAAARVVLAAYPGTDLLRN